MALKLRPPPPDAVFAGGAFDQVSILEEGRVGCFSCQGVEVPTAWELKIGLRILDDGAEAFNATIWFCAPCLDMLAELLNSRG